MVQKEGKKPLLVAAVADEVTDKKKLHEPTEEKKKIEQKLSSGQYATLSEMATDINDGQPSKLVEEILFKNMMRIMRQEANMD